MFYDVSPQWGSRGTSVVASRGGGCITWCQSTAVVSSGPRDLNIHPSSSAWWIGGNSTTTTTSISSNPPPQAVSCVFGPCVLPLFWSAPWHSALVRSCHRHQPSTVPFVRAIGSHVGFSYPVFSARGLQPSMRAISLRGTVVLQHQQARGFWFGRPWTYYSESEPRHHYFYRRHRCFRYKYTETLNRGADGGRQPLAEDSKAAIKRIVHEYWYPSRKASRGRTPDFLARTPENPTGERPGHNIEDAERAPLEDLLFGKYSQGLACEVGLRQSAPVKDDNGQLSPKPEAACSSTTAAIRAGIASHFDVDYVIDPITNRKVLKPAPETTDTAADEYADPPSQTFKCYSSQFSSLNAPTDKARTWSRDIPSKTSLEGSEQPGIRRELHRKDSMLARDSIFDAASLPRQPVLESDQYIAELNDTPTVGLGTFSATPKDVFWHESGGIAPGLDTSSTPPWTQDSVSQYLDLDQYGPVLGQEALAESQITTQRYEDLGSYGAVRYLEPDGKAPSQESTAEYKELDMYTAFKSHEPDGKYNVGVEPALDYQELSQYQAFRSHEPDGKYALRYTDPGVDVSELERYSQPYLSHEPGGMYALENTASSLPVDGLSSYKPPRSYELNGKYDVEDTGSDIPPGELRQSQAVRSHEPNGKYVEEVTTDLEASDLANHEAFGYEESETRNFTLEGQGNGDATELREYGAMRHGESDGLPEVDPEEGTYDAAELSKYQAVEWNELDGKPTEQEIAKHLFEYDLRDAPSAASSPEKTHYRKMLDLFMAQSAKISDAVDAEANLGLKQSKERLASPKQTSNLTGNYARDFPEEFTRSWKTDNSGSNSTLLPTDLNTSEGSKFESLVTGPAVLQPAGALQPALDRHHGFDKAVTEESLKEADQSAFPTSTSKPVPTLYKVLVYDPTMQRIDTAETTSVVVDSATPLTPAEVLLRISNPSKFLPHFSPLQAEGFEIVSGAGDILIFRKVREAAAVAHAKENVLPNSPTEPAVATPIPTRPSVNPIDMTGGPRDYTVAASRFASPTGFVNYDLPPSRFESGIDVRREEPVFSGPKEQPNKDKKKNLPRRLAIGAAWVAGLSYSLGVVGDYFRTGGQSGKGPKGL